jgi:hypothetical protein
MKRVALLALALLALGACASPESTRVRAGGPGADVGNRGPVVVMHDGSQPYAGTPRISIAGPTRAPSEQAGRRRR